MKITKLNHCCLLIEHEGVTLLTDPGSYSDMDAIKSLTGIDAFIITHEHADHFHIPTLKDLLAKNPSARVITNTAVGNLLKPEDIKFEVVGDGQSAKVREVSIEGFGTAHAVIYKKLGECENTGYLIGGKLFYPGDALGEPGKPMEILALPVAGPWMKLSEALDYARRLKPQHAFGVHDAMVVQPNFADKMVAQILQKYGVSYTTLEHGKAQEF